VQNPVEKRAPRHQVRVPSAATSHHHFGQFGVYLCPQLWLQWSLQPNQQCVAEFKVSSVNICAAFIQC
jgi:hypothetical protein